MSSWKRRRQFKLAKTLAVISGTIGVVIISGSVCSSDLNIYDVKRLAVMLIIGFLIFTVSFGLYGYLEKLEYRLNRRDNRRLNKRKSA